MVSQSFLGRLGMALLPTLLAACASTSQFADQVVKSNLAQESAQNQLLLLNVLRAYERQPLHFTQIVQIRMPVGIGTPTFTLPTPFGPDFTTQIYNVSTAITVTQGVDTTVQNSQEFYRGITTPLPASLMLYYLEQGWPSQLVLLLFVREIQGGGLKNPLLNFPENKEEFEKFQKAVENLLPCQFEAKPEESKPFGPEYSREELKDPKSLAALKAADLTLAPSPAASAAGFQFRKAAKGVELHVSNIGQDGCRLPNDAKRVTLKAADGQAADKDAVTFILRSPEAMVYYLGEIARAQLIGQRKTDTEFALADTAFPSVKYSSLAKKTFGVPAYTLFKLRRDRPPSPAVSVDFDGATYWLAKADLSDRSMHVFSLLTQVLGLQNKGTDLPSIANVRVVQ